MPTDKNGKYTRVNPSQETNHANGVYHAVDNDTASVSSTKAAAKERPSVTVGKPSKAGSEVNKPRSSNTVKHPVVPAGKPITVTAETDGSGSNSTAGDPSFSPQASANTGGPMKMNKNKQK